MIDGFDRSVLVARLDAHPDLSSVAAMPRGPERRAAAFDALTRTAHTSQQPLLAALQPLVDSGAVREIESLYLPNAVAIAPAPGQSAAVRAALGGLAHVSEVRDNTPFALDAHSESVPTLPKPSRGLDDTNVRAAWSAGADGRGVTVGVVDSGLDVNHVALRAGYRGTRSDGPREDDYNWTDTASGSGTPADDGEHGTEVTSEIVGAGMGIAPAAKVIEARASTHGVSTPLSTLRALQWMLAPTRVGGSGADPRRGADIVNCSWGTGNGSDQFYRPSFDELRDAGIVTVTATGNGSLAEDGSILRGTVSAPASYPDFVSVGAIGVRGTVADTSSRGPSPLPHTAQQFTPMFVAPGEIVPAAVPGGRYTMASGTSIAAPIVSGAIADLMSEEPSASNDQVLHALQVTARDVGAPGPDDDSGYGAIDIGAAARALHETVTSGG